MTVVEGKWRRERQLTVILEGVGKSPDLVFRLRRIVLVRSSPRCEVYFTGASRKTGSVAINRLTQIRLTRTNNNYTLNIGDSEVLFDPIVLPQHRQFGRIIFGITNGVYVGPIDVEPVDPSGT